MLQYHVPAADISKMLRGQKYEPYGFVQKHPYIKHVSSISDLISKIIDIELGDFSRCQIKPDVEETSSYTASTLTNNNYENRIEDEKEVVGERIYSETCPTCSSTNLVRNGTCKVCRDCGSTTGCS